MFIPQCFVPSSLPVMRQPNPSVVEPRKGRMADGALLVA